MSASCAFPTLMMMRTTQQIGEFCRSQTENKKTYAFKKRFGGEFAESTVAGWGATTGTGRRPAMELQYLHVNITDSDDCKYKSFVMLFLV